MYLIIARLPIPLRKLSENIAREGAVGKCPRMLLASAQKKTMAESGCSLRSCHFLKAVAEEIL